MGVRAFRVGGEVLGSIFTNFLAVSALGPPGRLREGGGGGRVGPLRCMLWLAAVGLGISV